MGKTPDKSRLDRPKIAVNECALLVPAGKSSKLMAMRNKSQQVSEAKNTRPPATENLPDLKPEVAKELMRARTLIDDRISDIMKRFPEAKKNKLFSFRYGSVEAIKAMAIMAAFKLLGIDGRTVKMNLIADMNYHGKDARRDHDNI